MSTRHGDARSGEGTAADEFRRSVLPLSGLLLREARGLTHSHADAEDLVQETLLHAYAGFHGFQSGTNLVAWLRRIMRNRWISDHRRKLCRPVEVLADDVGNRISVAGTSANHVSSQPSSEEEVLKRLPNRELAAAMAALSIGSQLVVYYADVQGYPLRDVAELMNIPVGTVMSRLHRARRRLRDDLVAGAVSRHPGSDDDARMAE